MSTATARRALITGSTGGLGLAVARALAAQGHAVLLHGLAEPAEAEAACAAIARDFGVAAAYHRADLADPAAISGLMAWAGPVDILVNNAATRHFGPTEAMAPDDWDADLAINLSAAFHTIRLVLPGMRERGWGRIVNISSIYGLIGAAGRVGYVTTKTALIGLTRAVAAETARDNITCNAVCPATTLTPGIEARITTAMERNGVTRAEAEADVLRGKQPTGRFVEASAVAAMIATLCSEAGRDVTGAALPMDGGWSTT